MSHDIYDDHEQGERVRKWLSENGSSLIIGLLIALGAVYGWQKYESFTAEQRFQAAQTYEAFGDSLSGEQLEAAETQLGQLQEHYTDNLYADLAALRLAADLVDKGSLDKAAATLEGLRTSKHTGIADIAGLRLARVYVAQAQPQRALDLLNSMSASDELEAAVAEVRGDALNALGRKEEARTAYEAAIAAGGGTPRPALDMKLERLQAEDTPLAMDQTS